jgi:erythromycin esterase-like protein
MASVVILIALCAAAIRIEGQASTAAWTSMETDAALHALCGEDVVLLGEPPTHGFGNTLEYKAQLVRRLVSECQFNAVFFESGMYDYVYIGRERRAGRDVSDAMISAAIGGLWANQEVQSLVPFLRERMNAGSLTLAGLDDQLGAGSYASREMPADLTQSLADGEKSHCLAILQRHMLWQYADETPYSPADKQKILGCLDAIEVRLSATQQDATAVEDTRAMIKSLKLNFARDFTENDFTNKDQELRWDNDRDHSMYLNFKWLIGTQVPHSKIIVWAATVHTAKSLRGIEGFENRIPLGAYISQDYGFKAFSLGFSAYSGDYSFTHHPVQHLSDAPPSSLEGKTFARSNSDSLYLSQKQLHAGQSIPARILGTAFTTARWDQVLDGLVIFRRERAPSWINRSVR